MQRMRFAWPSVCSLGGRYARFAAQSGATSCSPERCAPTNSDTPSTRRCSGPPPNAGIRDNCAATSHGWRWPAGGCIAMAPGKSTPSAKRPDASAPRTSERRAQIPRSKPLTRRSTCRFTSRASILTASCRAWAIRPRRSRRCSGAGGVRTEASPPTVRFRSCVLRGSTMSGY